MNAIDWTPVTTHEVVEQIPYEISEQELAQAKCYQLWLERRRQQQNARDYFRQLQLQTV